MKIKKKKKKKKEKKKKKDKFFDHLPRSYDQILTFHN